MKAAELFIKCLENEKVEYIFGIPGEENLDVMDALLDSKIKFITTRHEQGAAFMADVYGRLTGKAGVCLSTLGPGATNLVTGVADANMDNAPVIAIAGQAATTRLHKESHQVLDLVNMFRPLTKYSTQILEPENIPEIVRKAFKLAQVEKPGACFIDFPENIAEMDAEVEPLHVQSATASYPAIEKVEQAADLISKAKHPIIMAGNGVARTRCSNQLINFAEKLNIPVATTFMAKGVMPSKHELTLGTVGLQSHDYVGCGFDRADLIICVGYDIVEYHPYLWHATKDRQIVHIDTRPAEVDAHYILSAGVVGDIGKALDMIADIATPHAGNDFAGLHAAGSVFQGLLRNPMADPYIIGTSGGAALGATIALLLPIQVVWLGFTLVPLAAFAGALVTVLVVYNIARVGPRTPVTTLLLAGFAFSSMLAAVMSFLMLISGHTLRRVVLWTMGGVTASSWPQLRIVVPLIVAGVIAAYTLANDLNAFLLGEEQAAYLGVNVERRKLVLLMLGSLLTGAAVSVSGLVGFIGLVVPHVARLIFGSDHRLLLPASTLMGSLFLVLADLVARLLLAPAEILVGIITAMIGAPFFIYLLRRSKREYVF